MATFRSSSSSRFLRSASCSCRIRPNESFTSTTRRISATSPLAFSWSAGQQVEKSFKLNDSLQDLAPLAQTRLALVIKSSKNLADDFILVHAAAVSSDLLPEILRNRTRHSRTLEEHE